MSLNQYPINLTKVPLFHLNIQTQLLLRTTSNDPFYFIFIIKFYFISENNALNKAISRREIAKTQKNDFMNYGARIALLEQERLNISHEQASITGMIERRKQKQLELLAEQESVAKNPSAEADATPQATSEVKAEILR